MNINGPKYSIANTYYDESKHRIAFSRQEDQLFEKLKDFSSTNEPVKYQDYNFKHVT